MGKAKAVNDMRESHDHLVVFFEACFGELNMAMWDITDPASSIRCFVRPNTNQPQVYLPWQAATQHRGNGIFLASCLPTVPSQ